MGSPSSARSTRAYSERSAWNGPSDEDMVAHQERARLSVKCPRPVLLLRHRVDERTMHEGVMRLEPYWSPMPGALTMLPSAGSTG